MINTKGRQLVEAFKEEIQKVASRQVQTVFREPLSKIPFDDLLQFMKDILANTVIKRSDTVEESNNSTDFDNYLDIATTTVVGNVLENSTVTDVEDTFDNTTDLRKISNVSVITRDRK